ncbi:MAG: hypothetical protein IPH13_18845 [Planctomycetes bacterium]|nr:hypothetical protein [Planctomycetota bacterium]
MRILLPSESPPRARSVLDDASGVTLSIRQLERRRVMHDVAAYPRTAAIGRDRREHAVERHRPRAELQRVVLELDPPLDRARADVAELPSRRGYVMADPRDHDPVAGCEDRRRGAIAEVRFECAVAVVIRQCGEQLRRVRDVDRIGPRATAVVGVPDEHVARQMFERERIPDKLIMIRVDVDGDESPVVRTVDGIRQTQQAGTASSAAGRGSAAQFLRDLDGVVQRRPVLPARDRDHQARSERDDRRP